MRPVLDFEPVADLRPVAALAVLGDDALESELAGLSEQVRADLASLECCDEGALRPALQDLCELLLAILKFEPPQVIAVADQAPAELSCLMSWIQSGGMGPDLPGRVSAKFKWSAANRRANSSAKSSEASRDQSSTGVKATYPQHPAVLAGEQVGEKPVAAAGKMGTHQR